MGNVKIDKGTQVFLIIGMIAMLAFAGFAAFKPVTVSVDVDEEAIAQLVLGGIVLPSENATLTSEKLDAIYDDIFRDDKTEDVAEELALDELDTKDFKRSLIGFLTNNSEFNLTDVDYRDIEDIEIRSVDVELVGTIANVTVEFKVYVSNYGDEDEEEKYRVSVLFDVDELDEDEDYDDAEAEYGEFTLIKFYD